MTERPEVIPTVKARGGVTPHIVRYVLMISLALAVAAMAWTYLAAPKGTQQGATTATDPQ